MKRWWEPTVEMPESIEDDEGIASARQDRATAPSVSVRRWSEVGRAPRAAESALTGLEETSQSDMGEERVGPPRRMDVAVEM